MKISSFKELLLKKSASLNMTTLVKYMQDSILLETIVESLEKADAQRKSNEFVTHFAQTMHPHRDPAMIHDALSHHASKYKAALNKIKELSTSSDPMSADRIKQYKDVANKHAGHIFKHIALTNKMTKDAKTNHTIPHDKEGNPIPGAQPKLVVKAEDPHAWSQHVMGNNNNKGWSHPNDNYEFLQKRPHAKYAGKTSEKGAYPLERISVNGMHLDINHDDNIKVSDTGSPMVEEHPFDSHPIFGSKSGSPRSELFRQPKESHIKDSKQRNAENEKFRKEHGDWFLHDASNPDKPFNKVHDRYLDKYHDENFEPAQGLFKEPSSKPVHDPLPEDPKYEAEIANAKAGKRITSRPGNKQSDIHTEFAKLSDDHKAGKMTDAEFQQAIGDVLSRGSVKKENTPTHITFDKPEVKQESNEELSPEHAKALEDMLAQHGGKNE